MLTYARGRAISVQQLLLATTIAQVFYLPAIILIAYLSDRLGSRRWPMLIGALGSSLWAFTFWPLVNSGSLAAIVLALTVALLFIAAVYGPLAAFLAELFPIEVRYTGFSFGFQVMQAVVGGTTPVLAAALVSLTGGWLVLPLMTTVSGAISFVAILWSRQYPLYTDDSDATQSSGRLFPRGHTAE
jgi:MFS family permease